MAGLNEGDVAYKRGDYVEALREFKQLATQGDAEAQYRLGFMYAAGQGMQQDPKEAVKWYRLAVAQGDDRAQFSLGNMYDQGHGVPQDSKQALKLYRLAALQGNVKAQFNLGITYQFGQGAPKDYKEAAKWYRLAAEQGDAEAQSNLGNMYDQGYGVSQDDNQAVKWYQLAVGQGIATAQHNLGVMYVAGRGVAQDYKEAIRLFQLAAGQGDTTSQHNLGLMYKNGDGVPKDDKEAVKWYRLAASQGVASSQHNLGLMYKNGEGVPQDLVLAYAWLSLSAIDGMDISLTSRDILKPLLSEVELAEAQRLTSEWRTGQLLVRDGNPVIAAKPKGDDEIGGFFSEISKISWKEMMVILFAIYLVVGGCLIAWGPVRKDISGEGEEMRRSSLVGELQGRSAISERKILAYQVILSLGFIFLWPVFIFSILAVQKEKAAQDDVDNADNSMKVLEGIRFQTMDGAGTVSCDECDYFEKITSFIHGPQGSNTGYQCQTCGKFSKREYINPFPEYDDYDPCLPLEDIPLEFRPHVIEFCNSMIQLIESQMQKTPRKNWLKKWEPDVEKYRGILSSIPTEELERIKNIRDRTNAIYESSLFCECGGRLSRDHILFCPKCKSKHLSYNCRFIT